MHRHWIFKSVHDLLEPSVLSPTSNLLIVKFQQLCGISKSGTVNNTLLYYFFKFSSSLGEDMLYFPLLYWFYFDIGKSFGTNFLCLLLTGQIVKDLIHLPRPPTQFKIKLEEGISDKNEKVLTDIDGFQTLTIAKLEHHFGTEYGFPSTHTLCGLIPTAIVLTAYRKGAIESSLLPSCLRGSALFLLCVACSRLYVGVHSICDLLGGFTIGLFVLATTYYGSDAFDELVYEHKFGLVFVFCFVIHFVVAYPRTTPWRASFGTASLIVGIWTGIAVSLWYGYNVNPNVLSLLRQSSAHTQLGFARIMAHAYSEAVEVETIASEIGSFLGPIVCKIVVTAVVSLFSYPVLKQFFVQPMFLLLRKLGVTPRCDAEDTGVDGKLVKEEQFYWVQIPTR
jgi:membrane-associated phospholipid phosphatase